MVLLLVTHFLVGIVLGAFFRIGIMLVVAAAIVAEGLLGWLHPGELAWYWVALACFAAAQAGYVVAAVLRPAPKTVSSGSQNRPIQRLTTPD